VTTRMDDLSDAAVETAESDVDRVQAPDFAAVLARAQGIRAELGPLPRVEDDVVLKPFVIAAIAQAEGDIAVMMLHGPPEEPARRSSRWRWAVGIGATMLAAAVALFVMLPDGWRMQARDESADGSQAVSAVEAEGTEAEPFHTKEPPPPKKKIARPEPAPAPAPAPEEEIAPEPPKPTMESIDAKVKRLDALAAEQLGDGKTDAADRTLQELIEIGGRRRLVELAFGDRFTIAHRNGDASKQVALWRAYLRRFPKGRLADDARAGLCRHAAQNRRDVCWTDYLRDFPGGAYAEQARREAGSHVP
jgi:hypothetical protein